MSETLERNIQLLNPSAVIDLFVLDTTNLGGDIHHFHGGTSELGMNIIWQGIEYTRYPIEVDGFEWTSTGTLPRPTLKAANIKGAMSVLAKTYGDLVGSVLTRKRTFKKYLDAINFVHGNSMADPNVHFPDEIWTVDRKSSENAIYIEFELAAAFDISGVMLPRRQCIQNMCTWKYRGPECGYTSTNYFDKFDQAVDTLEEDVCGKKLSSCELRYGANNPLPYGGFPGVGLVR